MAQTPTATRFPFTIRALETLQLPAAGRVTYHDTTTAGLSLRVTAKGAKTFTILARPKGKRPERVTLGRFPKLSLEAARTQAADVLADHSHGRSTADRDRIERQQKTFGDVAAAYFADRESAGARTVRDLRMSFELYLGALPDVPRKPRARERKKPKGAVNWQARKPSEIAPEEVPALRDKLGEHCGRYTANRTLQLFRAIVNFGREQNYVEREHAARLVDAVKLFREEARTRRLTADEVRAFFAALTSDPSPAFRDFLTVLLFTGARRVNVMALRWDELDLDARTWEIPAAKAKAGKAILLPLAEGALDVLRRRAQERDALPLADRAPFVFPAAARSGHMEAPKKQWAAFRVRAGIADVRLHDVRRTLGSFMVNTGASLAIVGKQLGHRDAKSTARYAHLELAPVRAALDRAEAALRQAAKAPAEVTPMPPRKRRRK
jgi:integrase